MGALEVNLRKLYTLYRHYIEIHFNSSESLFVHIWYGVCRSKVVTNKFSWCLSVSLEISLEWRPNPECIWMGILLEWITCSRFGFKRELDNISWVCGRRQHFSNSARPSNLGTKFFTKQNNFSTLAQSNWLFWQRGDERENKLKNLLEHQKIEFWRISPP